MSSLIKDIIKDLQDYDTKPHIEREKTIEQIFLKHEYILYKIMNCEDIGCIKEDTEILNILMKTLEYFISKYID